MKTESTQQEILLITGTRFSARILADREGASDRESLTEQERLEEACWNGLLPELLPELCEPQTPDHQTYLWQIVEAYHFLELDLGELPAFKDPACTLDPYLFLSSRPYN
ncbi:MAG TPA: hypothetical protein VG870_03435 [Chitinophagaceae bacterium]|nr:hypothetical protein [Chitinophagaceae bacterium]